MPAPFGGGCDAIRGSGEVSGDQGLAGHSGRLGSLGSLFSPYACARATLGVSCSGRCYSRRSALACKGQKQAPQAPQAPFFSYNTLLLHHIRILACELLTSPFCSFKLPNLPSEREENQDIDHDLVSSTIYGAATRLDVGLKEEFAPLARAMGKGALMIAPLIRSIASSRWLVIRSAGPSDRGSASRGWRVGGSGSMARAQRAGRGKVKL